MYIQCIQTMRIQILLFLLLNTFLVCESPSQDSRQTSDLGGCTQVPDKRQSKLVGGPCEGCEAIFEYPTSQFSSIDSLPDFNDDGPRIKISGTVYKTGGIEPACGVILYVYHTNQEGVYPTTGNETGWAKRHGYIRGWIQTDKEGKYTFYTLKPGTYPSRSSAAHIHITILEPNGKYYWLGSYLFAGDPLLTDKQLNNESPRGGSNGIIAFEQEGDLMVGVRNIELGKNVPNYE